MSIFLKAFIVGGLICVIGQLLIDVGRLTIAHVMSLFVVVGAVLEGLSWYKPLIRFAGAGATVPVVSFGSSLVDGMLKEVEKSGGVGLFSGIFQGTSSGIAAAIVFSFLTAVIFRPKG